MSIEVVSGSSDQPVAGGMSVEVRVAEKEALSKNIRAFESRADWLKKNHNWEWVVFRDVVFVYAFDMAARKAIPQFGASTCLVRQVG